MTLLRSARRIGWFTFATLDAIGRARLSGDGIAGRAARLQAVCAEIALIHGLDLGVRGTFPSGPAVVVANHVGYLDAIAIAATLACAPIAKSEVSSWPMIGTATKQLGVIFVGRDSVWSRVHALRRAVATLTAGVPVVNFPEGTTTDGTQLLPFSRGIFGIARRMRVPVVPVAVRCPRELAWTDSAPFVPHYVRMTRLEAPVLTLEVAEPIDPSRLSSAEEVAALAYQRIAFLLRDQLKGQRTSSTSTAFARTARVRFSSRSSSVRGSFPR